MPINPSIRHNKGEAQFVVRAREKGWTVVRSGWPDFLLVREVNGAFEFMAAEVKRNFFDDALRPEQMIINAALKLLGFPCAVYSVADRSLRPAHRLGVAKLPSNFDQEALVLAEKLQNYPKDQHKKPERYSAKKHRLLRIQASLRRP